MKILSQGKFSEKLYLMQPVLVVVAPIISMYATNADTISISDTVRPLFIVGCVATLCWIASFLIWKDYVTAAVASSAIMILLWITEGILTPLLWTWTFVRVVGTEHPIVTLYIILVFLALIFWRRRSIRATFVRILSSFRGRIPVLAQFLNIAVVVSITIPIFTAVFTLSAESTAPDYKQSAVGTQRPSGEGVPSHLPNIYLIILDAYGRHDELQEHFSMDNGLGPRLKNLEFYVADKSRSNYSTTLHSVSSTLNFNYIQNIFSEEKIGNLKSSDLKNIVRDNSIIRSLKPFGYEFVSYSSNFYLTHCVGEPYCIESKSSFTPFGFDLNLNLFEHFLVSRTFLHRLFRHLSFSSPYTVHRERVKNTLSSLPEHASSTVPKFILAHMVVPHEPFVFGENGEDVSPEDLPFSWSRISNEDSLPQEPGMVRPDYARKYRAQAIYVSKLVADAVEKILNRSQNPPIIIIQGDHGPYGFSPNARQPRLPILNAYFLPNGGARHLYPDITPVNSFRVVLNHYFNARLTLLPDTSYRSDYKSLSEFEPVTPDVADDRRP